MARELARRLDVERQLVRDPWRIGRRPAEDVWDIGNIGAEPERAKTIAFTAAYVEIEATYIVPAGSSIQSIEEVDKAGNRIAVSARSAYELWLSDNIQNAELKLAQGLDGSFDLFVEDKLERWPACALD